MQLYRPGAPSFEGAGAQVRLVLQTTVHWLMLTVGDAIPSSPTLRMSRKPTPIRRPARRAAPVWPITPTKSSNTATGYDRPAGSGSRPLPTRQRIDSSAGSRPAPC